MEEKSFYPIDYVFSPTSALPLSDDLPMQAVANIGEEKVVAHDIYDQLFLLSYQNKSEAYIKLATQYRNQLNFLTINTQGEDLLINSLENSIYSQLILPKNPKPAQFKRLKDLSPVTHWLLAHTELIIRVTTWKQTIKSRLQRLGCSATFLNRIETLIEYREKYKSKLPHHPNPVQQAFFQHIHDNNVESLSQFYEQQSDAVDLYQTNQSGENSLHLALDTYVYQSLLAGDDPSMNDERSFKEWLPITEWILTHSRLVLTEEEEATWLEKLTLLNTSTDMKKKFQQRLDEKRKSNKTADVIVLRTIEGDKPTAIVAVDVSHTCTTAETIDQLTNDFIKIQGGSVQLQRLNLQRATITAETLPTWMSFIKTYGGRQLTHLNLSENSIRNKDSKEENPITPLLKFLSMNETLTHLDLRKTNLNDDDIRALQEALSERTTEMHCDISENSGISEKVRNNFNAFLDKLNHSVKAEKHFHWVPFKYRETIKKAQEKLETDAVKAKIELREIFKRICPRLCHRLEQNDPKLTVLNLSGFYLTDKEMEPITQVLQKNTLVNDIDLSNNEITLDSVYWVAKLLTTNKTIQSVDFQKNMEIKEEGQRFINGAIIPYLQHRRGEEITCEDVDLHACRTELVHDICLINLEYYHKLISLNLSHLGKDEAVFFPDIRMTYAESIEEKKKISKKSTLSICIRQNKQLKSLDLSYNNLTVEILCHLRQLLTLHHTLQIINLRNNRIENEEGNLKNTEKRLKHCNPHLTKIDLSANFIDKENDHIFDNENSLFFSKKQSDYVESLIDPSKIITNTGYPQFVVAALLVESSSKIIKHASILVEDIRRSGQRFFERFHLIEHEDEDGKYLKMVADKTSGTKIGANQEKRHAFDPTYYEIDAHSITRTTADTLRDLIDNEAEKRYYSSIIPSKISDCSHSLFSSEKVKTMNCLRWCCDIMRNAGIKKIKYRISPDWSVNANKPDHQGCMENAAGKCIDLVFNK